jgi:hypothetical protein
MDGRRRSTLVESLVLQLRGVQTTLASALHRFWERLGFTAPITRAYRKTVLSTAFIGSGASGHRDPNNPYARWKKVMAHVREQAINLALLTGLFTSMTFGPQSPWPYLAWMIAGFCGQLLTRRGVNWQTLATNGVPA